MYFNNYVVIRNTLDSFRCKISEDFLFLVIWLLFFSYFPFKGDKKTGRKKRKREQLPSETVQRRASTRIAERIETKRQKKIQMSVMAVAMNCSDRNFAVEDELLSPPEKRFKVRNTA